MAKNEIILAIKNEGITLDNGFNKIVEDKEIELDETNTWFGPRAVLEEDMSFRQIIPYCIVRRKDHILMYERPVSGGEDRLHGLKSIGFGGHINIKDVPFDPEAGEIEESLITPENYVVAGYARELSEEIPDVWEYAVKSEKVGYIYFGNDVEEVPTVNKVHLGVVHVVDLPEDLEIDGGKTLIADILEIGKCDWVPVSKLTDYLKDMELWSREVTRKHLLMEQE